MSNEVINMVNASFYNQNYLVLDNINLKIELNSFTAIIGRSGSGKSTLLKLMSGIQRPSKGTVEIYGRKLNELPDKELIRIKKKIGFSFQDSALLSNLSIRENLALPLKFHFKRISDSQVEKKITYYLEKINLMDSIDLRPAQLSQGEQKMVALVRSLITEPELLFIDEPLSNIDATIAKNVMNLIKEYSDQAWTTVIAATHNQKIIKNIATKIVVLDNKSISLNIDKEILFEDENFYNNQIIKDMFG